MDSEVCDVTGWQDFEMVAHGHYYCTQPCNTTVQRQDVYQQMNLPQHKHPHIYTYIHAQLYRKKKNKLVQETESLVPVQRDILEQPVS